MRPVQDAVKVLFQELLKGLPQDCALPRCTGDDRSTMVELVPSRTGAASLSAIVPANESEGVTLIAGRGSFFEIPEGGRRYTNLPLIEEMKAICNAVIAGHLEEWVVLDGDEVLQGRGILQLERPITVRWSHLSFRLFQRKRQTHHRYEPWVG